MRPLAPEVWKPPAEVSFYCRPFVSAVARASQTLRYEKMKQRHASLLLARGAIGVLPTHLEMRLSGVTNGR